MRKKARDVVDMVSQELEELQREEREFVEPLEPPPPEAGPDLEEPTLQGDGEAVAAALFASTEGSEPPTPVVNALGPLVLPAVVERVVRRYDPRRDESDPPPRGPTEPPATDNFLDEKTPLLRRDELLSEFLEDEAPSQRRTRPPPPDWEPG